MRYYVSWSPLSGEATYSRCFSDKKERDRFANGLHALSVHVWDNE